MPKLFLNLLLGKACTPGGTGICGSEDSAEAAAFVLGCLASSPRSPGRSPAASRVLTLVPAPRSPRLAAPPSGLQGPGFLPGLRLWISVLHPILSEASLIQTPGWEAHGRFAGVFPPLWRGLCVGTGPGAWTAAWGESRGMGEEQARCPLPSARPSPLPSVRVEGSLPLTASSAPTASTCPKRSWGRTQEAGGLVSGGCGQLFSGPLLCRSPASRCA